MQPNLSPTGVLRLKLLAVFLALAVLAAVAARDLAPQRPIWEAAALGIGLALVVAATVVAALWVVWRIDQAVLRAGGTDTQWLWFRADPPGLERARSTPVATPHDSPPPA